VDTVENLTTLKIFLALYETRRHISNENTDTSRKFPDTFGELPGWNLGQDYPDRSFVVFLSMFRQMMTYYLK
jgi:hypothetical protein